VSLKKPSGKKKAIYWLWIGELKEYADRVIDNPATWPLEMYLAAVALLRTTQQMTSAQAKPILRRVASALQRALSQYLSLPAPLEVEVLRRQQSDLVTRRTEIFRERRDTRVKSALVGA
jgi:hypothetical protein